MRAGKRLPAEHSKAHALIFVHLLPATLSAIMVPCVTLAYHACMGALLEILKRALPCKHER